MTPSADELAAVLESASRLQSVLPDAVLVGGAAAAHFAGHRDSSDHDHVLVDLRDRFDAVLDALEATDGWVTNRVTPRKLILGELGDIESGVRQLIRKRPIEVSVVSLASGHQLRVPTLPEILRIKGYLIVARNQTRDYLDVVALAESLGDAEAAATLASIDDYYADQHDGGKGVASQLVRQLADPLPKDVRTTRELHRYKNLDPRWHEWSEVVGACRRLAESMVTGGAP